MRVLLAQVLTIDLTKPGAYVVEKGLMFGDCEDVQELCGKLLTQPIEELSAMAASKSGKHVAKNLLQLQKPETKQEFRERLLCPVGQARLKESKPGRSILRKLEECAKNGNPVPFHRQPSPGRKSCHERCMQELIDRHARR